ncbi:MAG TPA: MFS transporter [Candidatus Limnocylindria bacterium]
MRLPAVLVPLRHRDFRLLWAGQTVSIFGNFIYGVALPFQILALGGSALQLGIGASIASGAMILSLLVAGALVDRLPRRRVILVSDLVSGIVTTVIAVLGITGTLRIEHLYVASAFFGVAFSFVGPAISAIIPELIPADVLVPGNAVQGLSRQIAQVGGPVVGGAVVALSGAPMAFALDAFTFFFSFAAVLLVARRPLEERVAVPLLRQIRDGLVFTFGVPWLWITIFLWAFINMANSGPFVVALPLLVRDVLFGDARTYGAIIAAMGAGEVIGTFTISQMRVRRVGVAIYAWAIVAAVASVLLGLLPLFPVILVMFAIRGLSIVGFGVLWQSALQRHVPREMLGRVVSIDWFGAVLMGPVAPVVFVGVVDAVGPAASFVVGGVASIVLLLPPLAVRSIRELE